MRFGHFVIPPQQVPTLILFPTTQAPYKQKNTIHPLAFRYKKPNITNILHKDKNLLIEFITSKTLSIRQTCSKIS